MRRLVFAFVALAVSSAASAQFHDQGMINTPSVKTEYVDPKQGTNGHPLVIGDCLFGSCQQERLVYAQSNDWAENVPCNTCTGPAQPGSYWALIDNNEPRADSRNTGPPDASLPRALPAEGIFGFETLRGADNLPGDNRWRAHLVLDLIGIENPVFGGIPFLGFGEFSHRGNRDKPLGYLNPSRPTRPSVLTFGERLWDAVPTTPIPGGTQPAVLASYVWMVANWGTSPKAIFITLYHYNLQNSVPPGVPAIFRWSWPITQSAFYPGADIVYIDAEDMGYYCNFDVPSLALHQDVAYRVDMNALFRCVSNRNLFTEPMPATPDIPVTQVLWANESTGIDGDLWTDVHDQRVVGTQAPAIAPRASNAEPAGVTRTLGAAIARRCAAIPGCAARAALVATGRQSEIELPIDRQPSRPDLLRALPVKPRAQP
jgi:hypothetical protein